MTLSEFIRKLQKLETEGHGDKCVFGTHSSSGAVYCVGSGYVTDYCGDAGPFDDDYVGFSEGDEYITIYLGN